MAPGRRNHRLYSSTSPAIDDPRVERRSTDRRSSTFVLVGEKLLGLGRPMERRSILWKRTPTLLDRP